MFDFTLAFKLISRVFSTKRKSLRYPTPVRIACVVLLLPAFLLLILVNRCFMLLDWVFFPAFRRVSIKRACFIIGVPRSATTYLFHLLANDNQFTCFKLWEILFAPSIIQKFFWVFVIKLDRIIGRPVYKLSLLFDKLFLSKISRIHDTSLIKPEEDEMLLLYPFASMYLAFFFPETDTLDQHIFFDEDLEQKKREKLMKFYKRCVQRHLFVFDRDNSKYFLSKNPCFISKTASIASAFPDAKLIYMLRSPYKTIPSTISLNANVYSMFSGIQYNRPLAEKTTNTIIRWYTMAEKSIEANWKDRYIAVPFKKITRHQISTVGDIYQFLDMQPGPGMDMILQTEEANSGKYKSNHRYDHQLEATDELSTRLSFLLEGEYQNDL